MLAKSTRRSRRPTSPQLRNAGQHPGGASRAISVPVCAPVIGCTVGRPAHRHAATPKPRSEPDDERPAAAWSGGEGPSGLEASDAHRPSINQRRGETQPTEASADVTSNQRAQASAGTLPSALRPGGHNRRRLAAAAVAAVTSRSPPWRRSGRKPRGWGGSRRCSRGCGCRSRVAGPRGSLLPRGRRSARAAPEASRGRAFPASP